MAEESVALAEGGEPGEQSRPKLGGGEEDALEGLRGGRRREGSGQGPRDFLRRLRRRLAASTSGCPSRKVVGSWARGPRIPEVSPRHHVVTPPLAPPSRGGSPPQGRRRASWSSRCSTSASPSSPRRSRPSAPSVTSTSSSGSSEKKPEPRKKKVVSPRTSPRDSPRGRSQQAPCQHRKAPPLPRLDSGGSLARAVAAGALGDASDTPPPTGYGIWDDAAAAAAAAVGEHAAAARAADLPGRPRRGPADRVEYYFSVANLCKGVYLRGCMDAMAFVPRLDHVCTFKRLRDLCDDPLVVRRAVESSDRLNLVRFTDESSGANVWKVRTVDQPERWVLAASPP